MADPELAGVFRKPFAEQVAFFRQKLGNLVPTATWRDLMGAQHDRGFMVAGAAKADLLADLAGAVDKAIADGESLDAFRARFGEIVQRHGWQGWTGSESAAGTAWRTRVIYRTNAATSYAAGRYAQLQDQPLWVYQHGGSRDPRPQHLAWDGLTLPREHPFWKTHAPPNGWGCRCTVAGASSPAAARRLGGDPSKQLPEGWDDRDGRGLLPGVDEGWDYQPGASVVEQVRTLAAKLPRLPAEIGARLGESLPLDAITKNYEAFFDEALANRAEPKGAMALVGVLRPGWVERLKSAGVLPSSAEIFLRDFEVSHMLRDEKKAPIPADWLRELPAKLQNPSAVVLDRSHETPAVLLVFDAPGDARKLVLQLDYRMKKQPLTNLLGTGRNITADAIKARIVADQKNGTQGRGYTLIDGKL